MQSSNYYYQPQCMIPSSTIIDSNIIIEEESDGNDTIPDKRSGRRKIKIEYISDKSRRHITFSKRKAGIMKKAYELSTLTGTQVLLLVVSETGLVYTFTTSKLQPLVTKPEGKSLIQSCLNAPDSIESTSSVIDQQTQLNESITPSSINHLSKSFSSMTNNPNYYRSVDHSANNEYIEDREDFSNMTSNSPMLMNNSPNLNYNATMTYYGNPSINATSTTTNNTAVEPSLYSYNLSISQQNTDNRYWANNSKFQNDTKR
ncbi:uncharacterized protein BX663DRAFT_510224 [Cokeromyces recurvatus]|uniref:uncharacterized protein n=1 Tax=Cokeromyces recurvatus TaxID=90255 RepID=UPI00222008E6|nr:uncharacterized protein BX663DRAFT_510224 [Cokeromyces recurvatus]KAI7902714.1 hypothetical protein BX663DRAFT_510224 [Cokeromyces recurvatus]